MIHERSVVLEEKIKETAKSIFHVCQAEDGTKKEKLEAIEDMILTVWTNGVANGVSIMEGTKNVKSNTRNTSSNN